MGFLVRLGACVAAAGIIAACTAEPTLHDTTQTTFSAETTAPATSTTAPGQLPTSTTEPTGEPLGNVAVQLELVVTGFRQPVLTLGREGDDHLFVVDQDGRIHAIHWLGPGRETTLPSTVVLDLSSLVVFANEQGMLGAAFHPDDPTRLFVHYSRRGDGATVVEEYRVPLPIPTAAEDLNQLTRTLLVIPQPAANHNGGSIEFGPDGFLYIALGDGGGGGDTFGTAQDPRTLLGSILRIDIDADPYVIPADNPFVDGSGGAPEVWAYGLRNPWRISFDGDDLWVADVGQGDWEEANRVGFSDAFGANFGWSVMEGSHCFAGPASLCDDNDFITPVFEYTIRGVSRCAIMGGYVYRGAAFPDLHGVYLYADYCTGELFGLRLDDTNTVVEQGTLLQIDERITSLGTDAAGELFVLTLGGSVYLVTAT